MSAPAPADAPAPEPVPPWWTTLEPQKVTLDFSFDIAVVPPAEPEAPEDPDAPPPEPPEPPTLEGTFFRLTVPGEPSEDPAAPPPEEVVFDLAHPLSGERRRRPEPLGVHIPHGSTSAIRAARE